MIQPDISIEQYEAKDAEIAALKAKVEKLQNQLSAVLRLLKNGKSERFKSSDLPDQLTLFTLPEASQPEQPEKEKISYEREKKKKKPHPGRTPLPDHLPRKDDVIEPNLDPAFEWKQIGAERSEVLEYEPGELYVRVIIRPIYKKVLPQVDEEAEKTEIVTADLPDRPIPGSYATASLLAYIIIAKIVDHLPLYRQIRRFKRDYDLILSKSTLNDWFAATCTLLEPLYEVLREQILKADYLQADESRIEVLTTISKDKHGKPLKNKRKRKPTNVKKRRGWMWVAHDPIHKRVLFDFQPHRDKAAANALLDDFAGYLQVDGYASYEHLLEKSEVIYIACMAHMRRKFYDARSNDRKRAVYALSIIEKIYAIERIARPMPEDERCRYRLQYLQPLLVSFKEWLDTEYPKVTPKSAIGKAINYTRNRYEGIENILYDGRLEIDNNLIENKIRPLALGRKNYLFAGSNQGAHRLAILYSFVGTCKAQDVNPHKWLKKVLEVIPNTPLSQLPNLLPGKLKVE